MDRESLSYVIYLTSADVLGESDNQCHACFCETTLSWQQPLLAVGVRNQRAGITF